MGGLKTEHCVEIWVPKNNGKKKFGSGYTLGPSWVITAHHVLFGDDIDPASPVQIVWWDETAEKIKGGEPVLADREKSIVWWHKEHDIALIRCNTPYSDAPGAKELLSADRPSGWESCRSAGYLSNLHNESGRQRRETPEGKFGLCSKEENIIDINDLSITLHNDDNWAGFSGSPVFVEEKLIAVIRTIKAGEKSLTASLIIAALDSAGDGKNQSTLRNVLFSTVHRAESSRKTWPSMRIHFPKVDGTALDTNLECRWGLWRLSLLGILSKKVGENSEETGRKLLSALHHVEEVLVNNQGGLNLRLPRRNWSLLNVSNMWQPPKNLEALTAKLSGNSDAISMESGIPGLILVFEDPRKSVLRRRKTKSGTNLLEQVKEWLAVLINVIFANRHLAVICILQNVRDDFLDSLEREFPGIPVEMLSESFPAGSGDNTILQAWENSESNDMNIPEENVLTIFKQLLTRKRLQEGFPVPSLDSLFTALSALDNDDKRKELWDLLERSQKINSELLEVLVAEAAASEDTILADIALRFAKQHDFLLDAWLETRLRLHEDDSASFPFLEPWLGGSGEFQSKFGLSAESDFGGSFVDELAMGVVRLSMKFETERELLTILENYTNPHLSNILRAVLKEKKEKTNESNYDFQLFENIKDTICGCRCNILDRFPPSSFASIKTLEDELPFWLILSHRPDDSWLRIILKSCPSVRAVFGLLTDQEISSITRNKNLVQLILGCRRANRFSPTSNP